ncbi:Juvenile hormone epoxide hydrolase 2 [Orchesella cincta]|uniref:Epoxide hydrolase n=1 Tax=Orchesella cincta TaxID=48709 RepID=A0A1D2MLG7_ORCCI|nr:Juvenile hormone epoxide hydrolase 2 [Orchesella cincta]
MGLLTKIILLLIPIGVGYIYLKVTKTDPIPHVEDAYWGPKSEQGKKEDTTIRPFKIDISAAVLDDLKTRLTRELDSDRLVTPLEGVGFGYGFNSIFLKTVGNHWLNKYDWRTREKLLNQYPHFKTKIGGLDIHFQHVKPKPKNGVAPRPLIVLHGYPGSIIEYQKIIPLLSEPKNSKYNYELIIPSLPGYGFSSGAARPGMGTVEMANIFKRLMDRLGHKKFYAIGGDWGAVITSDLATIYPDSVLGAHSANCVSLGVQGHLRNFLALTFRSIFASPEEEEHKWLSWGETFSFIVRESGYLHIQATKPDTVGTALTHSPLGLAAYIMEKFSTWTNRTWIDRDDGGLLEKFEMDELLDNVMVYWVTGSITTAQRLYSEGLIPWSGINVDDVPTNVPFDCHALSGDIIVVPKFAISHKFTNIKRYKVNAGGGHFGAFEIPSVIAADAVSFFDSL